MAALTTGSYNPLVGTTAEPEAFQDVAQDQITNIIIPPADQVVISQVPFMFSLDTDYTKNKKARQYSGPQRPVVEQIPFIISMVNKNRETKAIKIGGYTSSTVIDSLILTPNPNNLTISSAKKINTYNTMSRWVEEHWGDEIDSITFSGTSFSFFAYGINGIDDTGLSLKDRNYTRAYQFLQELIKLYQVNGCIYQDERFYGINQETFNKIFESDAKFFSDRHPLRGTIRERLYVKVVYDYLSMLGYFESFDIIEDSASPFKFTYNAVYKAERTSYIQGSKATSVVNPVLYRKFTEDNLVRTEDIGRLV